MRLRMVVTHYGVPRRPLCLPKQNITRKRIGRKRGPELRVSLFTSQFLVSLDLCTYSDAPTSNIPAVTQYRTSNKHALTAANPRGKMAVSQWSRALPLTQVCYPLFVILRLIRLFDLTKPLFEALGLALRASLTISVECLILMCPMDTLRCRLYSAKCKTSCALSLDALALAIRFSLSPR